MFAGVTFCHVKMSRWDNLPTRGQVHVTSQKPSNSSLTTKLAVGTNLVSFFAHFTSKILKLKTILEVAARLQAKVASFKPCA